MPCPRVERKSVVYLVLQVRLHKLHLQLYKPVYMRLADWDASRRAGEVRRKPAFSRCSVHKAIVGTTETDKHIPALRVQLVQPGHHDRAIQVAFGMKPHCG